VRYAAIGDSFTEGVGDELADGSVRGWADLVAAGLATARAETVFYANVAVRGRLLEPIVTDQLRAALSLSPEPTLLTLNGGGNDMMRPGCDPVRLAAATERAIQRCLDAGVQVVLLSGADPSDRLPFGRVLRRRGEVLTAAIGALADRYQLTFVDAFHDAELRHPGHWSPDRLHLNATGHSRVAELVLGALGYSSAAAALDVAVPPARRFVTEVRYYQEHVGPWIGRRLRGQSSGDNRTGKHLDWIPVDGPPASATPE
jgi:lysophospholipase L1-like esterase